MLSSRPQLALYRANEPAASKTPHLQTLLLWARETACVPGYKVEEVDEAHLLPKASSLIRAPPTATTQAVAARHMFRPQNPGLAAQVILTTTLDRQIPIVLRLDHVQVVFRLGQGDRDDSPSAVQAK